MTSKNAHQTQDKKIAVTVWWWVILAVMFLLACAATYAYSRHALLEEQERLASSLSQKLLAPMVLNDKDYAQHVLGLLKEHDSILSADLVDANGAVVASYGPDSEGTEFALAQFSDSRSRFEQSELLVMSPVSVGREVLGNIHLRVDSTPELGNSLGSVTFVFALAAAFMLFAQMRGMSLRIDRQWSSDDSNTHSSKKNEWFSPKKAVDEGLTEAGISVRYVPITHLESGTLQSVEALVHWERPSGQIVQVSPAEFSGLAERSGLILPFAEWVLDTAIAQVAHWRKHQGSLGLSFNISAQQFLSPTFPNKIRSLCAQHGLALSAVRLEIHEGVLTQLDDRASKAFEAFSSVGLALTVDGFGSTTRSSHLLQTWPIQAVKFDRRLMAPDGNPAVLGARMKALARMAASLHVAMMADGLTNLAQEQAMISVGCHLGQGNGVYQSMSSHTLNAVLSKDGSDSEVVKPWQEGYRLASL